MSTLAIIFFANRLLFAWSWKRRSTLARQAVQERLPQLMILHWEEAFEMREWGQEDSIHHPLECCNACGEAVLVNVITDALSGKVVDVQTRKAFQTFHNI